MHFNWGLSHQDATCMCSSQCCCVISVFSHWLMANRQSGWWHTAPSRRTWREAEPSGKEGHLLRVSLGFHSICINDIGSITHCTETPGKAEPPLPPRSGFGVVVYVYGFGVRAMHNTRDHLTKANTLCCSEHLTCSLPSTWGHLPRASLLSFKGQRCNCLEIVCVFS